MTQTAYVDFSALKQQVSIAQVVQMLGLKMKVNGNQMRGECPACKSGGDRALTVNLDKGYFCFAEGKGGDAIALASHITGKSARDAAQQIATHFRFAGNGSPVPTAPATAPQAPRATQGFNADQYLKGLDPASELLQPLGVSPETLQSFRAGYCKTGVHRGKLAIALCDREGNILGFCGRSLDGSTPLLTFPTGIEPRSLIFGQDKLTEGEARLLKDPLEVMAASEVGEQAVCFLSDDIEAQQLEVLASLLDAKKARIFF